MKGTKVRHDRVVHLRGRHENLLHRLCASPKVSRAFGHYCDGLFHSTLLNEALGGGLKQRRRRINRHCIGRGIGDRVGGRFGRGVRRHRVVLGGVLPEECFSAVKETAKCLVLLIRAVGAGRGVSLKNRSICAQRHRRIIFRVRQVKVIEIVVHHGLWALRRTFAWQLGAPHDYFCIDDFHIEYLEHGPGGRGQHGDELSAVNTPGLHEHFNPHGRALLPRVPLDNNGLGLTIDTRGVRARNSFGCRLVVWLGQPPQDLNTGVDTKRGNDVL